VKTIARWASQYILPFGAPGVFLLALADSGLVPIAEGVDVLLFAQVVRQPGRALLYAALATAGSLLGCIFLYYISRLAGEVALARRASPQRIERVRRQIEKYEALTLVLPAMVPLPLPMKLFVIASGVFRVHFARFVIAIAFARVVRYFGIALLAYHFGNQTWIFIRQHAAIAIAVTVCILGLFYWFSEHLARKEL
jgi:membrane protein YqaA with SNARE-associated domain